MNTPRPADNFLMRHAAAIAITAVTLLMLMAAFVFYQQSEAGVAARGWVNHTYDVKGHTQALLSKLDDAETGERGYVLTGDEGFLDPYKESLRNSSDARPKSDALDQHHSIAEELDILRRLTPDNPTQQQNLDDVDSGVKELLDQLASAIALHKTAVTDGAQRKIDFHRGKEAMDRLRGLIKIMTAEENHLLALRIQADDANARQGHLTVFSGVTVFYVLMVLAIWIYQRARQRAQTEILRYTRQLELSEEELKMQQEELKVSTKKSRLPTRSWRSKTRRSFSNPII
jgi:CHASE3 domain sensor protein